MTNGKKQTIVQQPKKKIWNLNQSPVKRITYHAASRYYQRFEHRDINEGELTQSDVQKAQQAIQKISFLWERIDNIRYKYENAIFVVQNRIVITLYPDRPPRIERIRRSREQYNQRPY